MLSTDSYVRGFIHSIHTMHTFMGFVPPSVSFYDFYFVFICEKIDFGMCRS